jgi:hypothetical protein
MLVKGSHTNAVNGTTQRACRSKQATHHDQTQEPLEWEDDDIVVSIRDSKSIHPAVVFDGWLHVAKVIMTPDGSGSKQSQKEIGWMV